MKRLYPAKVCLACFCLTVISVVNAQVPTTLGPGICSGVVANFNSNDGGCNSPSIYADNFDSSLYYHSGRGYWTDYMPPNRTTAPGVPRVVNIISPPFQNPNPNGTFNVGFHYIISDPALDRYQIRIISVTETSMGTLSDVEATTGVQPFTTGSVFGPTPYSDLTNPAVTDGTALMGAFQGNICIRLIDPDIINGPNTTFRVEVSYIVNGPNFVAFDDLSIGPFNAPLPVNFIGLVANRTISNNVDLRWDVSEEINVAEYQIERSSTGSNFETVGAVNAKGKSVYAFQDKNVPAMTMYYRIRSVDIDSKFKYSGIIRISGNNSFSTNLIVYPNPSKGDITVQHRKLVGKGKMTITSMDGKIIKTIFPTPGASHTPVNLNGVSPGIYLIRLDDETGYSESVKLLKN